MTDTLDQAKRALRAELRERRQLLSDAQREAADEGIRAQLEALIARLGAHSVSCFLSSPTEPGTRGFIRWAMSRGIRVLLPVMREDGLLDWTVASPGGEEVETPLGVPEAVGDLLGPIAVNDVDVMLIPAAAVDRTGMRMGWGRGYFDKTLGSMDRRPPVYAVIYDSELVDSVPRDVHDQPVSGVVTPTRTLDLPADR
ncbi:5-formyltetrahydrofolate cyclo-ligase [Microbacterium sp. MEC084]|uniref:5-formyltetrahydrofolate cyclo-ligase n=1 Tax=unclassified Microbacterium TaxID=2609290 RepID=UPI0006F427BE|nr:MULTISPECIES: 5-formyltetrahydrofolate cyclo-ligase [unclassified Microbacterium]KQZ06056.1 5-formyltetrahydrofolate cyclo-ligase [Microbacterium sp. Root53]MCD1268914.1 5-formyltetrahydrofolate cyclo-ligase [Microbacterium sp. MEC084]